MLVDLADWEMAETLPPVTYVAQDRLTAPVRSPAVTRFACAVHLGACAGWELDKEVSSHES